MPIPIEETSCSEDRSAPRRNRLSQEQPRPARHRDPQIAAGASRSSARVGRGRRRLHPSSKRPREGLQFCEDRGIPRRGRVPAVSTTPSSKALDCSLCAESRASGDRAPNFAINGAVDDPFRRARGATYFQELRRSSRAPDPRRRPQEPRRRRAAQPRGRRTEWGADRRRRCWQPARGARSTIDSVYPGALESPADLSSLWRCCSGRRAGNLSIKHDSAAAARRSCPEFCPRPRALRPFPGSRSGPMRSSACELVKKSGAGRRQITARGSLNDKHVPRAPRLARWRCRTRCLAVEAPITGNIRHQ